MEEEGVRQVPEIKAGENIEGAMKAARDKNAIIQKIAKESLEQLRSEK